MSVHQTEALVLRTYPYSESHRIVVFLTRDFGKLRGIAHGSRKPASRFAGALEPLTYLRLTFSRKEHQELSVVRESEIIRPSPAFQLDFEASLHLSYFAELLSEFGREEEESEQLFRLSLAVLEAIASVPVQTLARYFELWLLHLEGVLPDLQTKLPSGLGTAAVAMLKIHPRELQAGSLPSSQMKRLERFSEELIEYHLEKRLRTRKMLKELL